MYLVLVSYPHHVAEEGDGDPVLHVLLDLCRVVRLAEHRAVVVDVLYGDGDDGLGRRVAVVGLTRLVDLRGLSQSIHSTDEYQLAIVGRIRIRIVIVQVHVYQ